MKIAIALFAAAGFALAAPASAEEARIGVDVGPIGAGVTVGSDHRDRDRDRTTVIREEPREKVIIKEREEPREKVIIKERE